MFAILTSRISMKYWFKNVADNIYIYPKSAPRNLILQTRTSDCNSALVLYGNKWFVFLYFYCYTKIIEKIISINSK